MHKRLWLSNIKGENSYINVTTEVYPHWVEDPRRKCFGADVTIADCHRVICIDFSMDNRGQRKERVRKIDNLIDTLCLVKQEILNHDFESTDNSGS